MWAVKMPVHTKMIPVMFFFLKKTIFTQMVICTQSWTQSSTSLFLRIGFTEFSEIMLAVRVPKVI